MILTIIITLFITIAITAMMILALVLPRYLEEPEIKNESIPSDRHTYLAAKLCFAPDWIASDYSKAIEYINCGNDLPYILDISNGTSDGSLAVLGSVDRDKYLTYLKEYTNNPNWVILNNDKFAEFGVQVDYITN